MALILVVEQEGRYIERIRDALTSEGWQVRVVGGADEALTASESEPPQLVLVNRQIEGAGRMFETFSRRTGGPGVVALLPESATHLREPSADDSVAKPFTDQDLRLAVRRGLRPDPDGPPPSTDAASTAEPGGDASARSRQLTAQDIFGDLVAEVESEIRSGAPAPEKVAESPTGSAAESTGEEARGGASTTREKPAGRSAITGELDLEKTLSGLRRELAIEGPSAKSGTKPATRSPAKAAAPAAATSAAPTPSAKRARPRAEGEIDVDALLSETLTGLDLARKKPPADRPAVDRKAASPGAQTTEGAGAAPAAGDGSGSHGAAGEEAKSDEREIEISFADLSAPSLQEVPEPLPDPMPQGPRIDHGSVESEVEVDLEMDLETDLEADSERGVERPAPAGRPSGIDELSMSGPGGDTSLEEWLARDEASMFVEPKPTAAAAPLPAEPDAAPAVSAASPPGDGQRFGQYTLLDRIAVGGMAEVWKARMTGVEGFQKTVAIKKILPHLTDNDDFVNMFVDEAKLAAQLSHPNIIHIYDLGKIGDHFYIAMEYVEGKNLRALLNESRRKGLPLPRGLALLIAARLASALDHAHRKRDFENRELGLVHRDVSPQNVLISEEGDIKLCDFGIVKAVSKASQTQMGALKGKLQYMSPEQAWGKDVDGRSDIFSLGSILFEMLTGRRLFAGESEISVLEAVRQCQVIAPRDLVPQIPEDVEAVTLKALEMDPDRRFQTAGQMQHELEEILYSVKPAPSPADLAEYLQRLAEAPELDEAALTSLAEATAGARATAGSAAASGTGSATGDAPHTPKEDRPAEASARSAGATGAAGSKEAGDALASAAGLGGEPRAAEGSGDAVAPTRPRAGGPAREARKEGPREAHRATAAEPSRAASGDRAYDHGDAGEGGRRGKLWLVVLIALVVLAGAAASYYYFYILRPGGAVPPVTGAPESGSAEGGQEGPQLGAPAAGSGEGEAAPQGEEGTETPQPPETTGGKGGGSGSASATVPGDAGERAAPRSSARTAAEAAEEARSAGGDARTVAAQASPPASERAAPTKTEVTAAPALSGRPEPPATTPTRTDLAGEPPTRAGAAASSSRETPRDTPTETPGASGTAPVPGGVSEEPAAPPPDRVPPLLRAPQPAEGAKSGTASTETPAQPETESSTEPRSAPLRLDREASEPPKEEPRPEARQRPTEPAPAEPRKPEPAPVREPPVREGDLVGPGPGVVPPVLVRFDKPSYPPIARRMKVEGDVVLSLLVDENGHVVDTRLIKGVREGVGLHEAALDAARRARYQPATKNGIRVKMWTTLRIPFRL